MRTKAQDGAKISPSGAAILAAMPILAVPVKPLHLAKSRLSPLLDARERAELTLAMAEDVIVACRVQEGWETLVVSRDSDVAALAASLGARSLRESGRNLTGAMREVEAAAGEDSLAVVLADLPIVSAEALAVALAPAGQVVAVRASSDGGTNVLVRRPASVIPSRFGTESFAKHAWAARRVRADFQGVDRPELAFDLDLPSDVLRLLSSGRGGRAAAACSRMRIGERLRAMA